MPCSTNWPTNCSPPDAYSWDALVELARRWNTRHVTSDEPDSEAEAGDTDDEIGEAAPAPADATAAGRPSPPPRTRRPRARPYLALLRLDVSALQRGMVEGDELCEIAGVGPIPVRIARQLLGDAVLKLVITRGVDVANLTHLGRGPTVAQRCALLFSDPRCHVEGCDRLWDEADHDTDYAHTKHTTLAELIGSCGHHHGLKTYRGWALVPGTGRRPMVPPDHPDHPKNARPPGDPPDPGDGPGTLFS